MSITPKPPSRHGRPERCRRDGWTLDRQASFLATLERTGNVRAAAAAAGMNRASAYRFRDRPGGERFRYAWTLALGRRREQLLQERLAKATHTLARLRVSGKGDTDQHPVFPREIGKGDTGRETAQHRQSSQTCRFSQRLVIPGLTRDPPFLPRKNRQAPAPGRGDVTSG